MKVLWAVDSTVAGPVLVRGRQLDGPHRLRLHANTVSHPFDVSQVDLEAAPRLSSTRARRVRCVGCWPDLKRRPQRRRLQGLPGMSKIVTDIKIVMMVVDGTDVLTWFERHNTVAPPAHTVNWSHIEEAGSAASASPSTRERSSRAETSGPMPLPYRYTIPLR